MIVGGSGEVVFCALRSQGKEVNVNYSFYVASYDTAVILANLAIASVHEDELGFRPGVWKQRQKGEGILPTISSGDLQRLSFIMYSRSPETRVQSISCKCCSIM